MEWTGERRRFAAYRRLDGHAFDAAAYARTSEAERDALAESLAEFLAAMHAVLNVEDAERLGVPRTGHAWEDGAIDRVVAGVPAEVRDEVERNVTEADQVWRDEEGVPGPHVVLHNDLHFGNLVLDGPAGRLSGVWDFSCVEIGKPSFDLRYVSGDEPDLMPRAATAYERITGRRIDRRAVVLADRLEVVFDAVQTDTTDTLVAEVARWRAADALWESGSVAGRGGEAGE